MSAAVEAWVTECPVCEGRARVVLPRGVRRALGYPAEVRCARCGYCDGAWRRARWMRGAFFGGAGAVQLALWLAYRGCR